MEKQTSRNSVNRFTHLKNKVLALDLLNHYRDISMVDIEVETLSFDYPSNLLRKVLVKNKYIEYFSYDIDFKVIF